MSAIFMMREMPHEMFIKTQSPERGQMKWLEIPWILRRREGTFSMKRGKKGSSLSLHSIAHTPLAASAVSRMIEE